MRPLWSLCALWFAMGTSVGFAQQNPPPGGAGGRSGRGDGQGGRGGAQQQTTPPVPSISQRPTGSSLGTIRVGAADNTIWFGWRVGMPFAAIKGLTFSELLARADAYPIALPSVVASSTQVVSAEVPKPLDYRLQAGERNAVAYHLRELNEQVMAYHTMDTGADASTRRKVFEFAKGLNAPVIITGETARLDELDALAEEFGINVALESRADPKPLVAALAGRSRRMGIAADLAGWMQAGIKPVDALPIVKDRLLLVRAGDRSALGSSGRAVTLGAGAGGLAEFFLAAYRAGIKPLSITIGPSGATAADYVKDVNAFERIMWPAMADRVRAMLASPAGKIRGPDRLTPEMRQQIDAATPRQAIAKPHRPRKLLVTDIQMYSGHETIPHGNLLLELMAKYTGAFEATFSNDLDLLKYPKIKEFDAVFLNSIVGEFMPDPVMREGFVRYVKEGGGMGAIHGTPWASRNWDEFADMIGSQSAPHRIEHGVLKVYDRNSPIVRPFNYENLPFEEEFYRFDTQGQGRLRWDQVRVLLTVALDDPKVEPRPWTGYKRPDNIYPVAWIRNYGKGRVFYNSMGHMPATFSTPETVGHFLSGIQFILGDLDADTTPNPPSALSAGKK